MAKGRAGCALSVKDDDDNDSAVKLLYLSSELLRLRRLEPGLNSTQSTGCCRGAVEHTRAECMKPSTMDLFIIVPIKLPKPERFSVWIVSCMQAILLQCL